MLSTATREAPATPPPTPHVGTSVHPLIARAQAGDFSGIVKQELSHIRGMEREDENYPAEMHPFRLVGETLYWRHASDDDNCAMCKSRGHVAHKTCPSCMGSGMDGLAIATSHMETPLDIDELDDPIYFQGTNAWPR